ncbi:FAD-dependent oxidoreductase [Ferribacterium limneticum]|uniref:FAD-dependent oxidoreductase n=1 Tax=Ferribacterium limneticum TaxID=76259 RepID=UPI001CFB77DB|nr:FAD-dependent oxidoreductase [Ferribacterium limneticum]UCV17800.1 FAD-dependent oxidoreductase [Ferribacterium limneticum]
MGTLPFTSVANAVERWDKEADVVVVGSGAAGLVAAVSAVYAGASVIIVEKAPVVGGTTAKSDGGYWIPNNRDMRAAGLVDNRIDAITFMARCARPQLFNPTDALLGLPEREYRLLETYYDNASKTVEFLEEISALKSFQAYPWPDYVEIPENKSPKGRAFTPRKPDGSYGRGVEIVRQLKAWLDDKKVPVLLRHRAKEVVRNERGEVVGLLATTKDGRTISLRAKKGVIFGSGGFGQNPEMMLNYQPLPIYGGLAVPGAEGDFVRIGQSVGAKLGNMANSWHMQILLEPALEVRSMPIGIVQPPGDSMILVNKYGERVVGEKRNYHDRTQAHFAWDALRSEYPNQLMFMVYDRRTAELFAGSYPLPAAGTAASYVISAASLAELEQAIQARLKKLSPRLGNIRLSDNFAKNLAATVTNFNRYAANGVDEQFQRGSKAYDIEWDAIYTSHPRPDTGWKMGEAPNPTMHPFQSDGPYYAIIVGATCLDTNGGPVINSSAQVLDADEKPISGLYGAGNCIASPAAQGYWGGGATIGPAMIYGFLAGSHAARSAVKQASSSVKAGGKQA